MLKEQEAKKYWEERAEKLNECAVGFGDQNLEKQNVLYEERKKHIFKYVSRLIPTIDYGCGIGRYAKEFLGEYVGYDITKKLLNIARQNNSDKSFILLEQPYFTPPEDGKCELLLDSDKGTSWFEQFFTATVLQHCHDEVVVKLFKSIKENVGAQDFTFCLYENSCKFEKPHVIGRYPERYYAMVAEAGFKVLDFDYYPHIVKGEEHSLIRIKVA